jgi:hypothetical protein
MSDFEISYSYKDAFTQSHSPSNSKGRGGRDRMVVRFTTTYAIRAYHH